jgi:6-phosphogluconolactonase (cycloisomerase 2 family)
LIGAASAVAGHSTASHGVVFVQTNEPSGNNIDVFDRGVDGRLTLAGRYATGGSGAVAAPGTQTDPLGSQGSLALTSDGHTLVGVNAGTDTISSFQVDGDRLHLRSTVSSGGQFPTTVAVNNELVYVGNAGGVGIVRGFRLHGSRLVAIAGSSRSLGLANSSPPNFLTTIGQVGFSPDGSKLLVTTKAGTTAIDVFQVEKDGTLSESPVVSPAANPVPFAFTSGSGRIVDAEAGTSSVTTYALDAAGTLSDPRSVSDGEAALCWITRLGQVYYGSNTGSNDVSSFTVDASGQPALLQAIAAKTDPGPIDLSGSNGYLYVETASGTVDEFAVNGGGSLTPIGTVSGLPAEIEGIVAS